MGPVGFDIGCGMMSARSNVSAELATPDRKLAFNREVTKRVSLGAGGKSVKLGKLSEKEFQDARARRRRALRRQVRRELRSEPRRASSHPRRRRLGHPVGRQGLARARARSARLARRRQPLHRAAALRGDRHALRAGPHRQPRLRPRPRDELLRDGEGRAAGRAITDIDLGYFTPESKHFAAYLNAVAAGGNFAILNRLVIFEQIADAFRKVFKEDLELVYEISHNLVQAEEHPEFGEVWVHRKGATRAFPAGHPALAGTLWETTGHPVLIPGSNRDYSYILMPEAGAREERLTR